MVELYNVFYTDQRVSIVMELMDGGSLQDHLDDVLAEREEEQRQQRATLVRRLFRNLCRSVL